MITEDYVSFETAKLLKEKGFDADIITYRDDFIQHGNIVIPLQECLSKDKIKTPTLQMAMKWLREVHNISIEPLVDFDGDKYWWSADVRHIKKGEFINTLCAYNSYEEACEASIKFCLENLI